MLMLQTEQIFVKDTSNNKQLVLYFVKINDGKKSRLFICNKTFSAFYRSLVNVLKQPHVTSNKNSLSNHYKIIDSSRYYRSAAAIVL